MKKNLRIVSAAAAALLAVAPVAASAVSVNAADTPATTSTNTLANKPTIDLTGATTATTTNANNTVSVTPSFTLTSAIVKDGTVTTPATLQGTITASLNGTSVTADVTNAAESVKLVNFTTKTFVYSYDAAKKEANNKLGEYNKDANSAYVNAGDQCYVMLSGVGFSFGKANAGKQFALKLPKDVTVSGSAVKDNKINLDQYGNATGLTIAVKNIPALNAANTSAVSFLNTATGLTETKGSYMTAAQNGKLNVKDLLDALKKQYTAKQWDAAKVAFNPVNITTDEAAVKAELEKQNITVDAAGDFTAPDTFNVTLNATSVDNGKTASLPVVVSVPNGVKTTVDSQSKTIMHKAYFYNKDGKRVGTDAVGAYNTVTVATKTTTINGKAYYEVIKDGKATGQFINAGNIDGTKCTLKHNSYVYNNKGKRVKSEGTWKKGSEHTTYGASMSIKGHKMYRVDRNRYVKVANF